MNETPETPETAGKRLFREDWEHLSAYEREVIEGALLRVGLPRNTNQEFLDRRTLGERAADVISAFGGSWTFILIFAAWLIFWAVLNTEILGPLNEAFDPYPYIFLNLILSMLAAIQAPIIMMSQKRAAARDHIEAEVDHEVNVRAELAIRQLDERLLAIDTSLVHVSAALQARAPAE